MPAKSGEKKSERVEVWVTKKHLAYLMDLIGMEGFGDSPPEVLRRASWDSINDLIAKRRLKQR